MRFILLTTALILAIPATSAQTRPRRRAVSTPPAVSWDRPAESDRWAFVHGTDDIERYADLRTARWTGDVATLWLWDAMPRPTVASEYIPSYTHQLVLVKVDCEGRGTGYLKNMYYFGANLVDTIEYPAVTWIEWAPDTFGETAAEIICS